MEDLNQAFSLKPNPVSSPQTVLVSNASVSIDRKGKRHRHVRIQDINRVRFWSITNRGIVNQGLALESEKNPTLRLEFGDNGMRGDGSHGKAFKGSVVATLEVLQDRRPELEVYLSTSRITMIFMFNIGLLLCLFSVLIGFLFLSQGALLLSSGSPCFFLIGAITAWNFRPWQVPETITFTRLLSALRVKPVSAV